MTIAPVIVTMGFSFSFDLRCLIHSLQTMFAGTVSAHSFFAKPDYVSKYGEILTEASGPSGLVWG